MDCQRCGSKNMISVSAKCDDRCSIRTPMKDYNDYPPYHLGIGGGDYIKFSFCANCGQIQGTWPLNLNVEE